MGCHFPSLEALPNPRIKLSSLVSPTLAGGFFTTEPPGNPSTTPAAAPAAAAPAAAKSLHSFLTLCNPTPLVEGKLHLVGGGGAQRLDCSFSV